VINQLAKPHFASLLGIADAAGLALTSDNFFSAEYSVLPFCFLLDQIARVRSEPFPSIF